MRILIADDERLVRYSLKSMLEEIKIPLERIYVAGNGEEMIEQVERASPDIAFVDIKMPKLNGLEAIKAARKLAPGTKWIILTSYPLFDYAKQAIGLGASGYLLKPVSPEELEKTIREVLQENKKDNIILNEKFESKINALFHNTISLQQGNLDFILSAHFSGTLIVFDSYLEERSRLERQVAFCSIIRNNIPDLLTNEVRIALLILPSGDLATIGAWAFPGEGREERGGKQVIERYFNLVRRFSERHTTDNLRITLLKTAECSSYDMLYEQLRRLIELSGLRSVLETGKIITLDELVRENEKQGLPALSICLNGLADAYRERNYLAFLKAIEALDKTLSNSAPAAVSVQKAMMRFLKYSLDYQSDVIPDDRLLDEHPLIEKLNCLGDKLLAAKQKTGVSPADIVNQVTAFVENNYMHDIGLAQIAYSFNITPNYLSSLFHKKIGATFVRFLTGIRLSKAKELLLVPNARVSQVARQVGYHGTRHFSRLFKHHFECYPSDYHKKKSRPNFRRSNL